MSFRRSGRSTRVLHDPGSPFGHDARANSRPHGEGRDGRALARRAPGHRLVPRRSRGAPASPGGNARARIPRLRGVRRDLSEGIRSANAVGQLSDREAIPAPLDYVQARMRDTHDLWHAVTGYRGDVLGELALLGFTFAQTWNIGIATIVAAGMLKTLSHPWGKLETMTPAAARATILDGFRRGRRAAWLPAQAWEALALPLEAARARLLIGAPRQYTPVRTAGSRPSPQPSDQAFFSALSRTTSTLRSA